VVASYTHDVLEPPIDHTTPVTVAAAVPSRLAGLGRGLDRALGLVAALSFASELLVAMMLPVIPLFAIELGATPIVLGLMVSISAVAAAGGQLIGGYVSDRSGARRLLPAGSLVYGLTSLVTPTFGAVAPLVASRAVSGLGSGAYMVGERLYIRQVVDRTRLAFANGLVQACGAAGVTIGPLLGGYIADVAGLRVPFVVVGIGSLVLAAVSLFLPARRREDSADRPVVAAEGTATKKPRGLAILLLANLFFAAGYGSFITTFTPYAEDGLSWTTTEIGFAFALFGLGNIVVGPWVGAAADRWGRRWVGALATIPIIAFAVALVAPASDALLLLLVFAAGGGTAGFTASWYALLGVATGGSGGGRAFGTVVAVSSLGVVVGALAAGGLWDAIDVAVALMVTVVAMTLAGSALATYPERRGAGPASEAQPA
jgi:MFS transporter, DHA1 family, multidrug resistance protein